LDATLETAIPRPIIISEKAASGTLAILTANPTSAAPAVARIYEPKIQVRAPNFDTKYPDIDTAENEPTVCARSSIPMGPGLRCKPCEISCSRVSQDAVKRPDAKKIISTARYQVFICWSVRVAFTTKMLSSARWYARVFKL
jgi:hypothetical protein